MILQTRAAALALATSSLIPAFAFAGTASRCRSDLESGGWSVFMSDKFNEVDTAALAACIYFTGGAGTLSCLGDSVSTVVQQIGWDALRQVISSQGSVLNVGNGLQAQVGICSKTYPIIPGVKGTDHYVYVRTKRVSGNGNGNGNGGGQPTQPSAQRGRFCTIARRGAGASDSYSFYSITTNANRSYDSLCDDARTAARNQGLTKPQTHYGRMEYSINGKNKFTAHCANGTWYWQTNGIDAFHRANQARKDAGGYGCYFTNEILN